MGREWGWGGLQQSVFRDKLITLGFRVLRHACANPFQLAEVAVTGQMARATGICLTPFLDQTERRQQDRSGRRARMTRVRCMMRRTLSVPANPDTAQDEKQLFPKQNRTIVPSSCRPSGDAGQERIWGS